MLRGGLDVLEEAGARLVGGHSAEGSEAGAGLHRHRGRSPPDRILRKGGLKPGDRLILTKPLGTGVLLAAAMRGKAKARWIVAVLAAMQRSSGQAARCLTEHGATACTDVTGFGLIGHLAEMVRVSDMDVRIDPARIPALDGAREMLEAGVRSTLHPGNAEIGRTLSMGKLPTCCSIPRRPAGCWPAFPPSGRMPASKPCGALGYAQATVIGIAEPMTGTGTSDKASGTSCDYGWLP